MFILIPALSVSPSVFLYPSTLSFILSFLGHQTHTHTQTCDCRQTQRQKSCGWSCANRGDRSDAAPAFLFWKSAYFWQHLIINDTWILTDTVLLKQEVCLAGLDSTPFLGFVEPHSWPGHPQGYISQTYTQQLQALLEIKERLLMFTVLLCMPYFMQEVIAAERATSLCSYWSGQHIKCVE